MHHINIRPPLHRIRSINPNQPLLMSNIPSKKVPTSWFPETRKRRYCVFIGFPHGNFHVFRQLGW